MKKRVRCKAIKKARCNHYDQPIWMVALRGKYQARCSGCGIVGPVVDEGPWAAQQALYSGRSRAGQGIVRKAGIPMSLEQGLRGVTPGSWCDHRFPIEVHDYDGGRRARCLRCHAVGPVREDAYAARQALLEQERAKR
jgi:hypothetical protein